MYKFESTFQQKFKKPRLGGRFSAASYRKDNLDMKTFDVCTAFVSFIHFTVSLAN